MNGARVERMIRETHTYPMAAWVGAVAGGAVGRGGPGIRFVGILCALVLAVAGLAFAPPSHGQERRELVIHSIVAETDASALVLEGRHFVDGPLRPLVYLGEVPAPLPISTLNERSIRVILPASLPAANYVVRVSRGSRPGESDQRTVDVGIVGPVVSED